MIIKMLNEFERRIDEHSENFNKELKTIKQNQIKMKNSVTEMLKYCQRNQQKSR